MGDGWETARRRTPGNDWVIVALGHAGNVVESLLILLTLKVITLTAARFKLLM
ncbi:allantoicase [Vibrio variabilis]|uniref:Allantoicase n=1 Tax=Vibrio variabilis TaxID=990271 RepID=A0ABQ0JQZ3_9VIBR|nr:allantoicase [Vibrio variabilis]